MKLNAEWILAQLYTTSMHSKMSNEAVLSHGEDIGPMNGHHPRPRTMSITRLIDVRVHAPQHEERPGRAVCTAHLSPDPGNQFGVPLVAHRVRARRPRRVP